MDVKRRPMPIEVFLLRELNSGQVVGCISDPALRSGRKQIVFPR
jgi:hypothetical protein